MAFFEIPTWCIDRKDISDRTTCDGDIYPNSGLPKLPFNLTNMLEILFLLILIFFAFFRRTFKVNTGQSELRLVVQIILTIIAIIDIIISQIFNQGPFICRFIRIFLVVLFIRSLRESIIRILRVVYDSKEIVFLLIAYNIFFSWIGTILFKGTQEGERYFSTLTEGSWNLLILLTTANFPDVMLPAYHEYKPYCIFFILYLIIGLFFMLNLILATYYSAYKNRVEKSLNTFVQERQNHLEIKFKEYDIHQRGYLQKDQLRLLLKEILKIKETNKETKSENLDSIVKMFDVRCNGQISLIDFITYFDIIDVLKIKNHKPYHHKVESTRCKQNWRKFLKHPVYECVMSIIMSLNFLLLLWVDLAKFKLEVFYIQIGINTYFLIEIIIIIYIYGFTYAFQSRHYIKLELLLQIVNIIILIKYLMTWDVIILIKTLQITIIVRALKLLKLLKEVQQWNVLIHTINALVSPFYTLCSVSLLLYFLFAVVGDRLFGGQISTLQKEIFKDSSVPDNYVEMNFNDLFSSMVTLFALMVVNNWFMIVQVHTNIQGHNYGRWFFILFYFSSVVVMLNIVIAFVIDMYSSVDELYQNKEKQKQQEEKRINNFFSAESPNMSYSGEEVKKAFSQGSQNYLKPEKRQVRECKSSNDLHPEQIEEDLDLQHHYSGDLSLENKIEIKVTDFDASPNFGIGHKLKEGDEYFNQKPISEELKKKHDKGGKKRDRDLYSFDKQEETEMKDFKKQKSE